MEKEKTPQRSPKRCSPCPAYHNKPKTKHVRTRNLDKADNVVLKRAKEIQANLGHELPTFLKQLTWSNVAGGAQKCYVPSRFFHLHLSGDGKAVTLINNSGRKYNVTYLQKASEFSAGWKKFSTENKLRMGDVLVFQLVGYFKFKVYKVRKRADKRNVPSQKAVPAKRFQETTLPQHEKLSSKFYSKDFLLFTNEGVLSSRPPTEFKQVLSIIDFNIVINGLHIDGLLSEQVRTKYYDLCCSRESYLHEKILEEVNNSKWVASIISKTVEISDNTRVLTYSTPTTEYASWKKLLHSFEVLGMNVGFISARLGRLGELSVVDPRGDEVLRMEVEEAGREILDVEERIENLEMEVSALKRKREELACGMETKRKIIQDRKRAFEEEVNAPW